MLMDFTAKEKTVKFVPKVLLQAQAEAKAEKEDKENIWDKGPWDEGHWSNRK